MTSDVSLPPLGHGLAFADLYRADGLERLDQAFLDLLAQTDPALADRLTSARAHPPERAAESALILALAPHLDDFLTDLFGIRAEAAILADRQHALAPLFMAKRQFVQRRAARALTPEDAAALDLGALTAAYETRVGEPFDELGFARHVLSWMDDEGAHGDDLALAIRLAAAKLAATARLPHSDSILFRLPGKRDPNAPATARRIDASGCATWEARPEAWRQRDGFDLTDSGAGMATALDQSHYCIGCHHQGRDSCRSGLLRGGIERSGCPLDQKISELHEVKSAGLSLAALGVITIDNPMVAGTGHRICNACMDACIYGSQGRDPVDTPTVETRTLRDVLDLPWGFEIYALLTRWNPLNLSRPLPRPASGRSVLVVGLGPAGYTLAHHLLQDGHAVAAIDGLKIEPLDPALSGIAPDGRRVPFQPVRDIRALWQRLGERIPGGFGGVAEYGITVRWDKNFLDLIRLLLERRDGFALYSGVRFGGAVTLDSALEMGFDHVALAMGAGRPTLPDLPGGLARGVRLASDFLMTLQLTGAARATSLANLQLRLPVAVIGGGLTAIDSATEALAYYPVQVEKFLCRVEALTEAAGGVTALADWPGLDRSIADEFITHARAIRAERAAAAAEGRPLRLLELLQGWGGATVLYRRGLADSPAWRNRDEVSHALEEGIRFAEHLTPLAIETDENGAARGLTVRDGEGNTRFVSARTVLIAAGTVPNTALAREFDGFALDGRYFQAVDPDGQDVTPEPRPKPATPAVLMRIEGREGRVSFFGDLHPSYAGNVVSAMASAKQGYPLVTQAMTRLPAPTVPPAALFARLESDLRPTVHAVSRLTPTIVELVVHAPAAARAFRPGQFFRLQNYERPEGKTTAHRLAMEGLALTGAWVDAEAGLVGMVVLEMGGSSDLVASLHPGEPVVLMGPTGAPTHVCGTETVLLAGGGLGNAVLFSIGSAFRAAGSRVLYFAGYKKAVDCFKQTEIEAAADKVVWCVDSGAPLPARRAGDLSFVGTIVDAIEAYGQGRLGETALSLASVDRVIAIGSDRMMAAVAQARHDRLAPWLKRGHTGIGSINAPMQCMLKEICAQCLQRHTDPDTGEVHFVFTCADQDQPLDRVDFESLNDRLTQNSAAERLGRAWTDLCLKQAGLRSM
ncbi:FAD-dependent oxidoreductase [Magnetospirillum molischianum]|uniref:FAD-binding FR-type domain-containing protein n=1 Tax=Magnetospirillum molischianum DSM 120 TaxID=1150626 RepID=H8FUA9_MAGML|nr:FAD-dependent oxidoreductase [Magnetospirillum molischianum]CCG41947.1 conserved hypothetical protein [Magnetospirillum molischianum DSM 120]